MMHASTVAMRARARAECGISYVGRGAKRAAGCPRGVHPHYNCRTGIRYILHNILHNSQVHYQARCIHRMVPA